MSEDRNAQGRNEGNRFSDKSRSQRGPGQHQRGQSARKGPFSSSRSQGSVPRGKDGRPRRDGDRSRDQQREGGYSNRREDGSSYRKPRRYDDGFRREDQDREEGRRRQEGYREDRGPRRFDDRKPRRDGGDRRNRWEGQPRWDGEGPPFRDGEGWRSGRPGDRQSFRDGKGDGFRRDRDSRDGERRGPRREGDGFTRGPRREGDRFSRGPRRDDRRPARSSRQDDERKARQAKHRSGGQFRKRDESEAPIQRSLTGAPVPLRPSRTPVTQVPKPDFPPKDEWPEVPRRLLMEMEDTAREAEIKELGVAVMLGTQAFEQGDLDRALDFFSWAKTRASRSITIREGLGICLYIAGDFEQAQRELQTYVRLSGRVEHNHIIADCARATGNGDRVPELIESMVTTWEAAPDQVDLMNVLEGLIVLAGYWLEDRNQPERAVAATHRITLPEGDDITESHLRLWHVQARAARATGDHQGADQALDEINAVNSEWLEAMDRWIAGESIDDLLEPWAKEVDLPEEYRQEGTPTGAEGTGPSPLPGEADGTDTGQPVPTGEPGVSPEQLDDDDDHSWDPGDDWEDEDWDEEIPADEVVEVRLPEQPEGEHTGDQQDEPEQDTSEQDTPEPSVQEEIAPEGTGDDDPTPVASESSQPTLFDDGS